MLTMPAIIASASNCVAFLGAIYAFPLPLSHTHTHTHILTLWTFLFDKRRGNNGLWLRSRSHAAFCFCCQIVEYNVALFYLFYIGGKEKKDINLVWVEKR